MSKTIALTLTRIHYRGSATLVTFFDLLNQQYRWVSERTGRRWLSFMKLDNGPLVEVAYIHENWYKLILVKCCLQRGTQQRNSRLKVYNNSRTWQRYETRKTKIVSLLVSNPLLLICSEFLFDRVESLLFWMSLSLALWNPACILIAIQKAFIFDWSVKQTLRNSPQPHSRNTALSLPGRVLLRKIFTSMR